MSGGTERDARGARALAAWLAEHEFRLDRFDAPVPEDEVAAECGLGTDEVRRLVREADPPVHHVWPQNRLFCLRATGPRHVGLDRGASIVGALELDFRTRGFDTARGVGTPEHIAALVEAPELGPLEPEPGREGGLWALRRDGDAVELWVVEARGKPAAGFEHHAVAAALSGIAPVRGEHLTAMFGAEAPDTPGRALAAARTLLDGWRARGLEPTVHVAIALPAWSPDVVWREGRPTPLAEGPCVEPLRALREFLVSGERPYEDAGSRAREAFGAMLADLDASVQLRELAAAKSGLCFRVLTAAADPRTAEFSVGGREPVKMSFIRRTADRIRRKLEGLTAGGGAEADAADAETADPAPAEVPPELAACRRDLDALRQRLDGVDERLGGLADRCAELDERLGALDGLRAELSRVRSLATVSLVVAAVLAAAVAVVLWAAL